MSKTTPTDRVTFHLAWTVDSFDKTGRLETSVDIGRTQEQIRTDLKQAAVDDANAALKTSLTVDDARVF